MANNLVKCSKCAHATPLGSSLCVSCGALLVYHDEKKAVPVAVSREEYQAEQIAQHERDSSASLGILYTPVRCIQAVGASLKTKLSYWLSSDRNIQIILVAAGFTAVIAFIGPDVKREHTLRRSLEPGMTKFVATINQAQYQISKERNESAGINHETTIYGKFVVLRHHKDQKDNWAESAFEIEYHMGIDEDRQAARPEEVGTIILIETTPTVSNWVRVRGGSSSGYALKYEKYTLILIDSSTGAIIATVAPGGGLGHSKWKGPDYSAEEANCTKWINSLRLAKRPHSAELP